MQAYEVCYVTLLNSGLVTKHIVKSSNKTSNRTRIKWLYKTWNKLKIYSSCLRSKWRVHRCCICCLHKASGCLERRKKIVFNYIQPSWNCRNVKSSQRDVVDAHDRRIAFMSQICKKTHIPRQNNLKYLETKISSELVQRCRESVESSNKGIQKETPNWP